MNLVMLFSCCNDGDHSDYLECIEICESNDFIARRQKLSDANESSPRSPSIKSTDPQTSSPKIADKNLEKMETFLNQSTKGFHILFEKEQILKALQQKKEEKDLFDFEKMKKIQDIMTSLIAQPSYYEKLAYLHDLDENSRALLIRTYFHIVQNTIKATGGLQH